MAATSKFSSIIKWFLAAGALGAIIGIGLLYFLLFAPNFTGQEEGYYIEIPKSADYQFVEAELKSSGLKSSFSFGIVSKVLKYPSLVKSGKYLIKDGMGNLELVRKLRSGAQDAINLKFRSHRTLDKLAAEVSEQMAFSQEELLEVLNNEEILRKYGLNKFTVSYVFIPNTYFVYWTLSPENLLKRAKTEYDRFWSKSRLEQAKKINLKPHEVMVLASIVQSETYMNDEKSTVAGVYLNRIRKGMKLEADPTVIYAHGDFTIKRVLNRHLEIDSPYNTYKYYGLPPGAINNPEISSINGVLKNERHPYIFFCAKYDFSGYHKFSKTLSEHTRYAKIYQRKLNQMNIYK